MATITAQHLAELLDETGGRHHQAYIDANGADPEWALWYAAQLQARMWDGFGRVPTRSELVFLLIGAERAHRAELTDRAWPESYAEFMLDHSGD